MTSKNTVKNPVKDKTIGTINIRVDNALKELLEEKAKNNGVTLTKAADTYLRYGLRAAGKKTFITVYRELFNINKHL